MEKNHNSFIQRAKFSQTVYHRVDSSQSQVLPLYLENMNLGIKEKIIKIAGSCSNHEHELPNYHMNLRSVSSSQENVHPLSLSHGSDRFSSYPVPEKAKQTTQPSSMSPISENLFPKVFKDAKSSRKSLSTQFPVRNRSEKGIIGKIFTRNSHANSSNHGMPSMKQKGRKESSWGKYFDHGGRVIAEEDTEKWMADLSKLFLGHKFASGAYSKLYYGLYMDEPVAIKMIMKPENDENGVMGTRLEKQFNTEVSLLSQLHHQNIIKLVAAGRKPPVFFLLTEYLSGGSLRAFLHNLEEKPLPFKKIITLALEIAQGMEYIHSRGVIHRDLKPENILFDEDGHIKIADFGIACEESYYDSLAEDPGTYRWMAPEMIKCKRYGRKVDVYSYGLVMSEILTGRIPYDEMTPIQAAFAVVHKNLRPCMSLECPVSLKALIELCWDVQPDKRPEFWQIVKVLEHFDQLLVRNERLEIIHNSSSRDPKKRLKHWIQKLSRSP